jgi:hypothetical protein
MFRYVTNSGGAVRILRLENAVKKMINRKGSETQKWNI